MEELRLLVSPSPHIRDTDTTEKILAADLSELINELKYAGAEAI